MDEIGRGTSTFDGLSLAWAAAEYLAMQCRSLSLFATHYFELTALPELLDGVANVHLAAAEHDGHVVFLHAVKPGPASQSYGLQVAQLAGVPAEVISRARERLALLESQSVSLRYSEPVATASSTATTAPAAIAADSAHRNTARQSTRVHEHPQPDLFATRHPSDVELSLRQIDPDSLSPREALELLYALKKQL